ncbi:MAG: hypothetical protein N0C88_09685 [Candidatus Thiodiazotropha lotti]|uniref:Uncharacterized protein n=1 Tax=Candidatus Thiodiazotropha lotti TaxID=2792787 RepID=A0A9E4K621_9GAMM|nr:hypothetical protein [Candidatus Thiodiazotropha lotti]MCG7939104.1 hypothetical protein [Candidatus Thiodiazotropha lotti]MCW4203578.1 hypothetical protein [Candidatus Thiodiazotropha lotti]MCW4221573.1 hypothetical protein [Candidatus Thiodiazotropha lotti]ODC00109.1 hypothetical protein A3197_06935 [Candidatus Thiodiazotropha endoloripes]
MNVAFPALLTFLLILPGFIFRGAFTRSERTQLDNRPFTSETVKSLILAIFLHALWLKLTNLITPISIDYQVFLTLFTAARGDLLELAIDRSAVHMPGFITYLMSIYIGSYLFGLIAQKLVIKLKLDRHPLLSDFFRFDTPWFYLLKGFNDEGDEADFVKLAVTVKQVEATYLYYGILEDFYLTDSGNLDRIILSSVVRRQLIADETPIEEQAEQPGEALRFYEISGDRLVFKYKDITSLNIEYYKIIENCA